MAKTQLFGYKLACGVIIPFFLLSESLQAAPFQVNQITTTTTSSTFSKDQKSPIGGTLGNVKITPVDLSGGDVRSIDLDPAPVRGRATRGTSTRFNPLNPDQATIKYTGQNVLSPTDITSEQYALLPTCPATITCPDINSTAAPIPSLCPDYCTRTRIVNPTSGVPPLISTTPAVCPRGYAQVASYNIQREIIYDVSRQPDIYIASLAELQDYRDAGWTCSIAAPQNLYVNFCQETRPAFKLNEDVMIGPYAGQYTSTSTFQCFLPPMTAVTSVGQTLVSQGRCILSEWIDCAQYEMMRTREAAAGQPLPPPYREYTFIYYHYRCSPPANGLFYTDRYAPVSLVCARVKQEWQQLDRPGSPAGQQPGLELGEPIVIPGTGLQPLNPGSAPPPKDQTQNPTGSSINKP